MAVVKYGLIISDIKGKVGGQVLQGGNNSKVLRNNTNKKNSKTSSLSAAVNKLISVTSQYRNLSPAAISDWTLAAASWPFIDKYGTTYYSGPFQCFTAYNRNLLTLGLPIVTSPNAPAAALDVSPFSFSSSTVANVTIDPTTVLLTSQYYFIYATAALSPGRNANNATYKLITAKDMKLLASLKVNTFYNAVFGNFIQGSQVLFKIVQVNPDYPFMYFSTIISTIIT